MSTKLAAIESISTGEKFISSKGLTPREYSDMRSLQNMKSYASKETMKLAVRNCEARGFEFTQETLEFLGVV